MIKLKQNCQKYVRIKFWSKSEHELLKYNKNAKISVRIGITDSILDYMNMIQTLRSDLYFSLFTI
jgi:hypothetical protein